jgi:hypothetical protein
LKLRFQLASLVLCSRQLLSEALSLGVFIRDHRSLGCELIFEGLLSLAA